MGGDVDLSSKGVEKLVVSVLVIFMLYAESLADICSLSFLCVLLYLNLIFCRRTGHATWASLLLMSSTASEAPSDLIGQVDLTVELLCERPHQARVLLECAATENSIETLLLEKLVGLRSSRDAADAGDEQLAANLILNRLGERGLVAWSCMRMLLWVVSTC